MVAKCSHQTLNTASHIPVEVLLATNFNMYERWGLKAMPFEVVPSDERAINWAGRPREKRQIERLARRWSISPNSDISILWALWGQGKTHTLKYLNSKVKLGNEPTLSHYVQLPALTTQGSSAFASLYRQIMQDFPLKALGDMVFDQYHRNVQSLFNSSTEYPQHLYQLLWLIGTNSRGADVARLWFQGENVVRRDLDSLESGGHRLSVPSRPRNAQDCLNTLNGLIGIATGPESGNFVLLIDEFQRIGALRDNQVRDICDNLHLLFNSNPQKFHMVLTFALGNPQAVSALLTGDLLSRIQTRVELPAMDLAQAQVYLNELLSIYHTEVKTNSIYHPFTDESGDRVIDFVVSNTNNCTPRKLNMLFQLVLEEIMIDRDPDDDSLITLAEVDDVLEYNSEDALALLDT